MRSILIIALIIQTLISQVYGNPTDEDLELVLQRRRQGVVNYYDDAELANQLRNSLTADGVWTDVDYTTGCEARRANWPAQEHFHRILTMSSFWYQNQGDSDILTKIHLAMDYWFERDFDEDDCINGGGKRNCPCGTPGFWNTNWYCQMILMPGLVGNACMILKSNLTAAQLQKCGVQTMRAYVRIDGDPGLMGPMTGANLLDVSLIAVSNAVVTFNHTLIAEAYGRIYNECRVTPGGEDGIKIDGSYFQHDRQIYSGNYGKVFKNALLKTFIHTQNTSLVPPPAAQRDFLVLMSGSEWFVYRLTESPVMLNWQYSVIGRMVSFKFEDWQGLSINLDEVLEATNDWDNSRDFQDIVGRLKGNPSGVNPGPLIGTRHFQVADYMVHRGTDYIVTLKMFSRRSTNSECNNSQNPYGFHLSDGAIYTWLRGSEYLNVFGAWDWYMIPGTTVDHGATPLACNRVQHLGVEDFVGAVTLGQAGVAVMNYTNPMTASLQWSKTYIFFPNSYVVQFVGNPESTNKSAPVITTLDQRQLRGDVFVNGNLIPSPIEYATAANSVWHDRVGYEFQSPSTIEINTMARPSNWSVIGISEGYEPETLFSAAVQHADWAAQSYITHLDISQTEFDQMVRSKASPVLLLNNEKNLADAVVRGATYGSSSGGGERIIGLAFWEPGTYTTGLEDILAVSSDERILLILERKPNNLGWTLAIADPTQTKSSVNIMVRTNSGDHEASVPLPQGGMAGSTITPDIPF